MENGQIRDRLVTALLRLDDRPLYDMTIGELRNVLNAWFLVETDSVEDNPENMEAIVRIEEAIAEAEARRKADVS